MLAWIERMVKEMEAFQDYSADSEAGWILGRKVIAKEYEEVLKLLDSAYVSIKCLAITANQDIDWEMACTVMDQIEAGLVDDGD